MSHAVKGVQCICRTIYSLLHDPDFYRPSRKWPSEKIMGKGENAGNQHFLLFSSPEHNYCPSVRMSVRPCVRP